MGRTDESTMFYDHETLDRETEEIVSKRVCWNTISEIERLHGAGPRQTLAILHHMGVLAKEGENLRVIDKWVRLGIAKTNKSKLTGRLFDVINEEGQAIIADAWDATVQDYQDELTMVALAGVADFAMYEAKRMSHPTTTKKPETLELRGQVYWLMEHWEGRKYMPGLVDKGHLGYSDIP